VALLEYPTSPPLDRDGQWAPSELRRVVVRMSDGEVLQIGTAPNRDSALVLARTVIAEIEEPHGEWPLAGERMLRPESILSVDVLTTTYEPWRPGRATLRIAPTPASGPPDGIRSGQAGGPASSGILRAIKGSAVEASPRP
jgi:hypothetical protein